MTGHTSRMVSESHRGLRDQNDPLDSSASNINAVADAAERVGSANNRSNITYPWTNAFLPGSSDAARADSAAGSRVSSNVSVSVNDRVASSSRASTRSATSNATSQQVYSGNPSLFQQPNPAHIHSRRTSGQRHMRHYLHSIQSSTPTQNSDTVQYDTLITSHDAGQVTLDNNNTVSLGHTTISIGRSNTAPSPKRPPASHSSYGVGTTVGPPVSFDTRRTPSTDRVWSVDRSKSLRVGQGGEVVDIHQSSPQQQRHEQPNSDSNVNRLSEQTAALTTPPLVQSSPETADYQSIDTPTDGEETVTMDVANGNGLTAKRIDYDTKSSNGSQKSEDLFLNIARHDVNRPSSSKEERRRSRNSMQYFTAARPASSHNTRAINMSSEVSADTPSTEVPAYRSKPSKLQFGQLRHDSLDDEPAPSNASGDDYHYSNRDTLKPAQRSSIIYRGKKLASEIGYAEKTKYNEQTATESTTSTNAPSTVWDELDDLKSRIRKLELTGKLPASSAAAMSTTDRPRTATTAATTLSTSPKHNKAATPLSATFEGVSPNVHPLLHDALANAKAVVSHDVYQKLQATAQDALQLASLTSFDGASVRSGVQSTSERQIRRRTESMCRSLTELAIALASETKSTAPTSYRPPSREYSVAGTGTLRSRRYSQGNDSVERQPASVRIQSRLDQRRSSTQYAYTNARRTSPEIDSPTTALPQYPGSGSRITRVPAGIRTRRYADSGTEAEDSSPAIRPVSRAQTDVIRRGSRDTAAFAREYTAKHPLPSTINTEIASSTRTPLPSNLSTNFLSRRKNISPGYEVESSPLAPKQSLGRISIVQQSDSPDVSEAPNRSASTRLSLGLAGRIGSVSNRLRGTRTERIESRNYRDPPVDPGAM